MNDGNLAFAAAREAALYADSTAYVAATLDAYATYERIGRNVRGAILAARASRLATRYADKAHQASLAADVAYNANNLAAEVAHAETAAYYATLTRRAERVAVGANVLVTTARGRLFGN